MKPHPDEGLTRSRLKGKPGPRSEFKKSEQCMHYRFFVIWCSSLSFPSANWAASGRL